MSFSNNNYGASAYSNTGMGGLNNSFSNMSFQPAGGSTYSSIPAPPPLPQQSLFSTNQNSVLGGRNLYTRDWSQVSQYSSLPSTFFSAPVTSTTSFVSAPAVSAAPSNMLPAPINDGRRYARLTGQKAGSRRSRRHLVQPLNGTGLTTLPAGVPVEGLAAASMGTAAGGRRARRTGRRAGAAATNTMNGGAGFTGTSNYISLGGLPVSSSGSVLPFASSGTALPLQQQQFARSTSFVSAPAASTALLSSAPIVSAPIIAAAPASNMLPAPINDGRRYARLTGQKAGSRRSRRHLVQPLNGTGLQTLPAGVPVEGLAAASMRGTGRRSRRTMASRGLAAPLATSVVAPAGTTALAAPHLAQIPLSAPAGAGLGAGSMIKQDLYTPIAQPSLIGGATF